MTRLSPPARESDPGTRTRVWRLSARAVGAIVGFGAAWLTWMAPLQVSDSLLLMLDSLPATSAWAFGWQHADSGAFFRPLFWAQVKWVMDWWRGDAAVAFKLLHAGLVVACVWLLVRMLHVRTRRDFMALPLACTVLVGSHTFLGLAREAFPVNHYLEVIVACLAVANLALARAPGLLKDLAASAILAAALLTLETGALVWVCMAAGYATGARGISKRGVWLATAVVLGYIAIRVFTVGMPVPGLTERSSGFGFERLDPPELTARFGSHPWVYYLYNVVCSVFTVVWSEPRAGEWMFARALTQGEVPPWMWIGVVSSALLTVVIAFWSVRRPQGHDEVTDRHEAYARGVFPAVLLVNAVICYSYTKDVLMAPAGVFMAAAAYFAVRRLLASSATRPAPALALAAVLLLAVTASAWAMRAGGFAYNMREAAFIRANDWAIVEQRLAKEHIELKTPAERVLVQSLKARAAALEVPNPHFAQPGLARYVDRGQR